MAEGAPLLDDREVRDGSAAMGLTTSQYLLWTGQKLHPEAPLYNMVHTFEVRGPLDPARFERAYRSVLGRSDALRMAIEEHAGTPVQRPLPADAFDVPHVDLSAEPDPEAAAQAWVAERAAAPLDLGAGLVDAALLTLAPDRHVWYLNQHHLVTDITSTVLVCRLVADAYARDEAGTLDAAPPLPPFADYVAHEAAFAASPRAEAATAHWRAQREA
ncbi:MAG: condensation domain-containing protein, partial [Bacteroidota bacterium]